MDNSNSKRIKEIKIRLSYEELEFLNQNVAKTGLSREMYLRLLIAQKTPIALPPVDYHVLIQKLCQIDNQLNRISQEHGNSDGYIYLHTTLLHLNDLFQAIQNKRGYNRDEKER